MVRAAHTAAFLLGLGVLLAVAVVVHKSVTPAVLLDQLSSTVEENQISLEAAARLLQKARAQYKNNEPVAALLDSDALREDASLGTPAQIRSSVRREVLEKERGSQTRWMSGAAGAAARLLEKARSQFSKSNFRGEHTNMMSQAGVRRASNTGLHFTQGWPTAGGVMPTTYGEPASWGESDDYYYPGGDSDWQSSDGQSGPLQVGIIDGGAKKYSNGWGDDSDSADGQGDDDSSSSNPLYWFVRGSDDDRYDRVPSSENYGSDDESYPQYVQDPIKKLIAVRKQRDSLKHAADDLSAKVWESASHGGMAGYTPGSPEEESFIGGFLQGAVQASSKSVEQQGEFARQLDMQSQLVNQLEKIVGQLEEDMRQRNWKKTADKVGETNKSEVPAAAAAAEQPAPSLSNITAADVGITKFNIEFYMEAECPACKSFAKRMVPMVLNTFGDMINLTAIPFGNAAVINGSIFCQHGPKECLGNKIELCVMDRYPEWQTWFPVFKCIEKSYDSPENASKVCLPKFGMDTLDILDCAKGDKGELLHLNAAKQTLSLDPPHQWTPWVVMNGKPLGDEVNNIVKMICDQLPADKRSKLDNCNAKYEATDSKEILASTESKCFPDKNLEALMMGN